MRTTKQVIVIHVVNTPHLAYIILYIILYILYIYNIGCQHYPTRRIRHVSGVG